MSHADRASFDRVVVGVDGRQGGRDAIALARLLAAPGGRVTLAHVHSGAAPSPVELVAAGQAEAAGAVAADRPAGASGLAGEAAKGSGALLEQERAAADVEAELAEVGASSVGRGLHQLAEDSEADLLVVGSTHRGFVGRVLMGDDTRASLNGAACAVAVAPLGYARDLARLDTIGVGYDGSEQSKAALALAREIAARHGATLRALQIVQILSSAYAGFGGVAWGDAVEAVLADANKELHGIEGVQGEAVLGLPGEELAVFGSRVDLLVVGSRGYGPLRRLMLGSTSQYLAGHARCALLVLPRTSAGGEAPAGAG